MRRDRSAARVERRPARDATAGGTIAALVAATAVGVLLVWATPDELLAHPLATAAGIEKGGPVSAVTVVVSAVAWVTAARVVAGGFLIWLARWLPGVTGRACRHVGRSVTPRLLRGSLEAMLGVALVATATSGSAALAGTPPLHRAGSAGVATPVPAPSVAPPPPAIRVRLDRPVSPERTWATTLDRPDVGGGRFLDRPRLAPAPSARARSGARVTVRDGDSLWAIAKRHLAAGAGATDIALAWPRWYAANRSVIGPDPDLLLPGQQLVVPHVASDVPSRREAP